MQHNEVRRFHMLMLLLTARRTAQEKKQSCSEKQGRGHTHAHTHTHMQQEWLQPKMNCHWVAFSCSDELPKSTERKEGKKATIKAWFVVSDQLYKTDSFRGNKSKMKSSGFLSYTIFEWWSELCVFSKKECERYVVKEWIQTVGEQHFAPFMRNNCGSSRAFDKKGHQRFLKLL